MEENAKEFDKLRKGVETVKAKEEELDNLADDIKKFFTKIDYKEEANKNWISAYGLFDLYSNKLIQPTIDENGELQYNVWLTNGVSAPENKTLSAVELENENRLKFYCLESAMNYINWLQQ